MAQDRTRQLHSLSTHSAPPRARGGGRGASGDGRSDALSYEAELEAVFNRLDLNKDGVLDAKEILAAAATEAASSAGSGAKKAALDAASLSTNTNPRNPCRKIHGIHAAKSTIRAGEEERW